MSALSAMHAASAHRHATRLTLQSAREALDTLESIAGLPRAYVTLAAWDLAQARIAFDDACRAEGSALVTLAESITFDDRSVCMARHPANGAA